MEVTLNHFYNQYILKHFLKKCVVSRLHAGRNPYDKNRSYNLSIGTLNVSPSFYIFFVLHIMNCTK